MEISSTGQNGEIKSSKGVIFYNSIDYNKNINNEEYYDPEIKNPETCIPFAMRTNIPQQY